jgi:hypothetical protein
MLNAWELARPSIRDGITWLPKSWSWLAMLLMTTRRLASTRSISNWLFATTRSWTRFEHIFCKQKKMWADWQVNVIFRASLQTDHCSGRSPSEHPRHSSAKEDSRGPVSWRRSEEKTLTQTALFRATFLMSGVLVDLKFSCSINEIEQRTAQTGLGMNWRSEIGHTKAI